MCHKSIRGGLVAAGGLTHPGSVKASILHVYKINFVSVVTVDKTEDWHILTKIPHYKLE